MKSFKDYIIEKKGKSVYLDEVKFTSMLKNDNINVRRLSGASFRITDSKGEADFWANGSKGEFVLDKGLNAETTKIVKAAYKKVAVYKKEAINGVYLITKDKNIIE